jgi:hypothetical protein
MEDKESIEVDIEKEIKGMNPIDELCSRILVHFGQTIAMLLTNRDTARLNELKRIVDELFLEAEKAQQAARTVH